MISAKPSSSFARGIDLPLASQPRVVFSTDFLKRMHTKAQLDKTHHDGPQRPQKFFLLRPRHVRAIKENLIYLDIDGQDAPGRSGKIVRKICASAMIS
jgi:hypothetical protein